MLSTSNNNRYRYWWLIVVCLFVVGIIVQANTMLNFDVSWLMKAANQLLSGKHYYADFIETNPPMILYVYMPAVLLSKIIHLSYAISFKVYTFALLAVVIFLCNILMRCIFDRNDQGIRYGLLLAITFTLVIMPGYSFGEREHFAIILTLPYLFLLDLRLSSKTFNYGLIILVGIFAGVGFAIKPHFLFALIACEIFLIYKKRNLFVCFRLETFIIALIILLYAASLFLLTPDYLFKVWPLVYHLYFISAKEPFGAMLAQLGIVFWLVVLGFYCFLYEKIKYKNLAEILLFASIGYLIAYFVQHTTWYYHLLPTLVVTTILAVLFLCERLFVLIGNYQASVGWRSIVLLVLLQLSLIVFPVLSTVRRVAMGTISNRHIRTNKLFVYARQHMYQQKLYIFALQIPMISYLLDDAHATSASRFPSQVFMPGLVFLSNQTNLSAEQKDQLYKQKQEIINIVVADLQKYQPKYILVDMRKQNLYPNKDQFNYIKFFSQDPRFYKFFKNYKYITTLEHFDIYGAK